MLAAGAKSCRWNASSPFGDETPVAIQAGQGPESDPELSRIDRLREELVGSGLEPFDAGIPVVERRDEDDRDLPDLREIPQAPADRLDRDSAVVQWFDGEDP